LGDGLYLRIRKSSKTYIIRKTVHKKAQVITLGKSPTLYFRIAKLEGMKYLFEFIERGFSRFLVQGIIHSLQVGHERLTVLQNDLTQRVTDMVNDAELHFCFRIDRLDRIGQACQSIDRGDQDILHLAILQIAQHTQLEVVTLALGEI